MLSACTAAVSGRLEGEATVPHAQGAAQKASSAERSSPLSPEPSVHTWEPPALACPHESSIVPSRVPEEFARAKLAAFEALTTEAAERLGPARAATELGALAQTSIRAVDEGLHGAADAAFREASRLSQGVPVDIRSVKAVRQRLLQSEASDVPVAALQQRPDLLEQLAALPDTIDLVQARALQQRLGGRMAAQAGLETFTSKRLFRAVSDAIDSVALPRGQTDEARRAVELLQRGRRIERERRALLTRPGSRRQTELRAILTRDPERVPSLLFRRTSVPAIQQLRAVMDPADWRLFERFGVEELLADPARTAGTLDRLGVDFLRAYFQPETLRVLRDIANAAERVQLRAAQRQVLPPSIGERVAGTVLQVTSAGAIGLALNSATGAGLVLFAPPLLARAITHPATARLFSQGFRTSRTARGAAALATRLLGIQAGTDPEASTPAPAPVPRPTPAA